MQESKQRLTELAQLIRRKNEIEQSIAALIGRPALFGHCGEFIASTVFSINLHASAAHKGSDGAFASGPLQGRTVNVKWLGKREGLLDLSMKAAPDFYLVLSGPRAAAESSRGRLRPWLIRQVFLFEAGALHQVLAEQGLKLGTAASVALALWAAAEIYPIPSNSQLILSAEQREALAQFA